MPVFSSIVAIIFFLNCQRQDYIYEAKKCQKIKVSYCIFFFHHGYQPHNYAKNPPGDAHNAQS